MEPLNAMPRSRLRERVREMLPGIVRDEVATYVSEAFRSKARSQGSEVAMRPFGPNDCATGLRGAGHRDMSESGCCKRVRQAVSWSA